MTEAMWMLTTLALIVVGVTVAATNKAETTISEADRVLFQRAEAAKQAVREAREDLRRRRIARDRLLAADSPDDLDGRLAELDAVQDGIEAAEAALRRAAGHSSVLGDAAYALRVRAQERQQGQLEGQLVKVQEANAAIKSKIAQHEIAIRKLREGLEPGELRERELLARVVRLVLQLSKVINIVVVGQDELDVPGDVFLKPSEWQRLITQARHEHREQMEIAINEVEGTVIRAPFHPLTEFRKD